MINVSSWGTIPPLRACGPLRRGAQLGTVKGGHARPEHKTTPSLEAAEQVGREVRLAIVYQVLSVTSVPALERQPRCTV